MAAFDHGPIPQDPTGRGIVSEADAGLRRKHPGNRSRRNETALEIDATIFTDDAIRGLVEDWVMPMIVARLSRRLAPTPPGKEE